MTVHVHGYHPDGQEIVSHHPYKHGVTLPPPYCLYVSIMVESFEGVFKEIFTEKIKKFLQFC